MSTIIYNLYLIHTNYWQGKANTLNQQYVFIFSNEDGDIPFEGVSLHPVKDNLSISLAGVTKLLKGFIPIHGCHLVVRSTFPYTAAT